MQRGILMVEGMGPRCGGRHYVRIQNLYAGDDGSNQWYFNKSL